MRLFCLSIFFILGLAVTVNAQEVPRIDYFFNFDGGIFVHEQGRPIEDFRYSAIPESKTYSGNIQLADITPEGDMLCVLRGVNENDDKIDLLKITRDLKATPLFTITGRKDLPDEEKIDRAFGDVDYDPSTGKAFFSVIERKSKGSGLQSLNAQYSSRIYRVSFKGGACELIANCDEQIVDISSGGGLVGILKKVPGNNIKTNELEILFAGEKAWTPMTLDKAQNILSADLSPDGKSILILEVKSPALKKNMLKKYSLSEKKLVELETVKELDSGETGNDYRYTIDGRCITWSQKRINPWGENRLTFLMAPDKIVYPLVRDDFAGKYSPIPTPKNKNIELKIITTAYQSFDKSVDYPGTLSIAGTKAGAQPVFIGENADHTVKIFQGDARVIDQVEIGTFPNGARGFYYADERWFACPELELGERLLSFETIPYGKIYEKAIGAAPVNYDIHLSWNVGGRMIGLRIPEKEIFTGGDNSYLHLVLKYPFLGTYPVSEFVTPFYLLSLNDWIIDRPGYFGSYKTENHYFEKSASDEKGNLYLLDSLNSRILKWDARHKRHVLGWLPDGFAPLAYPTDMFIKGNEIWVNDPLNNRIMVFTLDGIPSKAIIVDTKSGQLDSTRFATVHDKDFSLINLSEKKVWEIRLNF